MQINGLARSAAVVLLIGLGPDISPLTASENEPYRVRGTLTALTGDQLRVRTHAGEVVGFQLKEDTGVFVVTPATLDDVKSGRFVGLTSIESGDRRVALEAHLFTEDLRGIGEGHYPWDLVDQPNMMTNATIAEIKEVGEDRALTVTYRAGEGTGTSAGQQVIHLPSDVPIVTVAKAGSSEVLAPGKEVFLIVQHAEDGTPLVNAAVVGDQGAAPPM